MAIAKLIMDEVQAPSLVRPLGLAACHPVNRHLAATRTFGAERQALFAVEPVDQIASDRPAFPFQHDVDAPISVADPHRNDLMHPLSECGQRVPSAGLALGRAVLTRQKTGPSLAIAV